MSNFEAAAANYAREQGCDGVIFGHIHAPSITRLGDLVVCNTGDWVEHCTALVEHADGAWEVIDYLSAAPIGQETDFDHSKESLPVGVGEPQVVFRNRGWQTTSPLQREPRRSSTRQPTLNPGGQ